jgi:quinoprotein glucose dehydrogenase
MMQRRLRVFGLAVVLAVAMVAWMNVGMSGQTTNGEWRTYGGDLASTRYSPLDQITKDNFNDLEIAWRFKTDSLGPRPEYNLQSTPLMIDGVVYSTAGTRRAVVALDAGTGELLWMHSENEGKRGQVAPRQLSGRGLAYWGNGRESRILYVTPGYQLIALDAKTGVPVQSFGNHGIVDLKENDDQIIDPLDPDVGDLGLHASPLVVGDVVVVGAALLPGGSPKYKHNAKGYARGFDVHTGKRLWIFHTIPTPGEFGNDTWENDSWAYTGNAGVWAELSADPALGLVYVPVELPTGDYYGGNRPGNGLFGETLVALDVKTGVRKWHFQLVHHGLWDMDIPCAPILADINVDGRTIKAVAQPTKQAWVYVFDRATGQPVWPIEERPVPQSTIPGEKTSPTQPFPTKPPAFDHQGVAIDDLIDFTPELRQKAVELVSHYQIGPLFQPPVVSTWPGPLATLHSPTSTGGANWQGGSLDPETNIMYIFSNTGVTALGLVPADKEHADFGYMSGRAADPNAAAPTGRGGRGGGGALSVDGLPLLKPPYGRITAIDLNKGDIVWQIAHGDTPDNIKNNPALKGLDIPRTGSQGRIGVLTTKTLVIAGEGEVTTQAPGLRAAKLRAYDKATGADAGAVLMPAPQTGSPMTYMYNGKQYIVVAVSGGNYTGELLAYRLPN